MTGSLRGDPVWVIAAVKQSIREGDGVITLASEILAVTRTREGAAEVLYIYGRSLDPDVIDVRIEASTLVDW